MDACIHNHEIFVLYLEDDMLNACMYCHYNYFPEITVCDHARLAATVDYTVYGKHPWEKLLQFFTQLRIFSRELWPCQSAILPRIAIFHSIRKSFPPWMFSHTR